MLSAASLFLHVNFHPKCPSLTSSTPLPLHPFLSSSPLCVFRVDPHFHACWLAEGCWQSESELSLSLLVLSLFLFESHTNKQAHRLADTGTSGPSNTSYLSYLLRAVLYAASKEIFCVVCQASDQWYVCFHSSLFDTPPVFLLSCMTFCWENISCVYVLGGLTFDCVN